MAGRAGVGKATVPTCPGDSNTLLVNNDPVAAVQRVGDVPDPVAAVQGYKEVYLPVTLECTLKFVWVTFHLHHANNT